MIVWDMVNYEVWKIRSDPPQTKTIMDFLFAPKSQQEVLGVKLPITKTSPTLLEEVSQLNHLEIVYIEMPRKFYKSNSPEVQQLDHIRDKFGGLVFPVGNYMPAFRD